MLSLPATVKIHLATRPTDMRKGFDGLAGLVRSLLLQDPFSGHLFVFFGGAAIRQRRDRLKVLFWDHGGFVLVGSGNYVRFRSGNYGRFPERSEECSTPSRCGLPSSSAGGSFC